MTGEELIARLRGRGFGLMEDAANRIEALTAKVKLMDDLDAINGEKIETLEAKLAKAVEVLSDLMMHEPDHPDTIWEKARATLAEIKGESHENLPTL